MQRPSIELARSVVEDDGLNVRKICCTVRRRAVGWNHIGEIRKEPVNVSTLRHLSILACVLALGLLLAAPAISEIKYYQESLSRAVPGTNNKTIRICDGQRDGNQALSEYQRFGRDFYQYIFDSNGGANGDCTNRREARGIFAHRTCELGDSCNRRFSVH